MSESLFACLPKPSGAAPQVERWLYLAAASREVLLANGFAPERFKVRCFHARAMHAGRFQERWITRWGDACNFASPPRPPTSPPPYKHYQVIYKRPTDLAPRRDVPAPCNILLADLADEGLLAAGLVPALRHAFDAGLLTSDAVVLPSSATVFVQVRLEP